MIQFPSGTKTDKNLLLSYSECFERRELFIIAFNHLYTSYHLHQVLISSTQTIADLDQEWTKIVPILVTLVNSEGTYVTHHVRRKGERIYVIQAHHQEHPDPRWPLWDQDVLTPMHNAPGKVLKTTLHWNITASYYHSTGRNVLRFLPHRTQLVLHSVTGDPRQWYEPRGYFLARGGRYGDPTCAQ